MLIMMKKGKRVTLYNNSIRILLFTGGGESDLGKLLHFSKSSESLTIVFPKMNNNEFYWKVV